MIAVQTVSPVLERYINSIGELWNPENRTILTPFQERAIGTFGDRKDALRGYLLANWAVRDLAPKALESQGFTAEATKLRGLAEVVDLRAVSVAYEVCRGASHSVYSPKNHNGNVSTNVAGLTANALWAMSKGQYDFAANIIGRVAYAVMFAVGDDELNSIRESALKILERILSV